uniref:Uncharacterized protein n=1 Tax=Brassica campestris TaxID=3711 RepID=M4F1R5_BRACM
MHGLVSYRRFGRAQSLRSDRAGWTLGHYVATNLGRARSLCSDRAGWTLGHYVATNLGRVRSLCSDRAGWTLGHYVATNLGRVRSLCSDRAWRVQSLRHDLFRALVRCLVFPPQRFSLRAGGGSLPRAVTGNMKLTKSGDGESSHQGGSSVASGLRGKTSRLAGELVELQGRWSETEAMLTAIKDSHSARVSKLEVAIGELERDLGKTSSSLLKEKKARKAKSSEVRWLQRQIKGDAGLASHAIQEATDALRSEFQARLAKISAFLGSLECIRSRDLALTTIEGGMAVVWSFQSEAPPTLEAEEARLSSLKSACFLPTCSEDPEGKDPMVGESRGDAAPGSDEALGEEGA